MQTTDVTNLPAPTLALLGRVLMAATEKQRDELAPGKYAIDEIVTLKLEGTVKVGPNSDKASTSSIPLLPALALFVRRMGLQRGAALTMLCEVMTEALSLGEDAATELLAETGVADAEKMIRDEVIAKLPRTPVKGAVRVQGTIQAVGIGIPSAE
jgi:hypothetical protein